MILHGLLREGLLAAPIFVIISNLNFLPLWRDVDSFCPRQTSTLYHNHDSGLWRRGSDTPFRMSGVQFKLQSKDWLRSYSRKTNLPIFGGHLNSIEGQIAAITREREGSNMWQWRLPFFPLQKLFYEVSLSCGGRGRCAASTICNGSAQKSSSPTSN